MSSHRLPIDTTFARVFRFSIPPPTGHLCKVFSRSTSPSFTSRSSDTVPATAKLSDEGFADLPSALCGLEDPLFPCVCRALTFMGVEDEKLSEAWGMATPALRDDEELLKMARGGADTGTSFRKRSRDGGDGKDSRDCQDGLDGGDGQTTGNNAGIKSNFMCPFVEG